MTTSLPAASAAVTAAASVTKTNLPFNRRNSKLSFHLSSKPKLRFSNKVLRSNWNHSTVVKAQLNEVRSYQWFSFKDLLSVFHSFWSSFLDPSIAFKVNVDGSSNAVAASSSTESEVPASEKKDDKLVNEPSPKNLASEASISEFITQVASLIKLVDSKDIVELQMKQPGCELIIRKKEALTPPASVVMMHSPSPQAVMPSAFPPAPPAGAPVHSGPAPSSTPTPTPSPPAPKSSKSSVPALKCPMAGTFCRSSAPGEPPFVKVGDKVQKGQVLCIIEAMKLMNEIEADQSGTIVEILVDDGKSVSVDTPLFAIEP